MQNKSASLSQDIHAQMFTGINNFKTQVDHKTPSSQRLKDGHESTAPMDLKVPLQCHNFFCQHNPNELYPTTFAGQNIYFCQHCFDLYEVKNCCYFCGQVYSSDDQNFLDGKDWIMCDASNCGKWMHIDCESNDGILAITCYVKDPNYVYSCPWCRTNNRPVALNKQAIKRERKGSQFRKKMEIQIDIIHTQQFRDTTPIIRSDPIQIRSTRFDDMLKKYGGDQVAVTQQELNDDLSRLRSGSNQGFS